MAIDSEPPSGSLLPPLPDAFRDSSSEERPPAGGPVQAEAKPARRVPPPPPRPRPPPKSPPRSPPGESAELAEGADAINTRNQEDIPEAELELIDIVEAQFDPPKPVTSDLDEPGPSPAPPKPVVTDEASSSSSEPDEEALPRTASSVPPQHLPTIGTFGGYDIVGRLALGGMAEVLLAREALDDGGTRYVALKRILEPHDDNESFVRMFIGESSLLSDLEHPHIARQFDQGVADGRHFMVLEWVNGVSLGKFIRRARERGVVPVPVIAEILARVADALDYAHARVDDAGKSLGIVHRDVSPHNIMIGYEGDVKLIDFGIAQGPKAPVDERDGVVKGKFAYMAPELCLGLEADRRADVFALGVCFWEAVAQRTLFLRRDAMETMRAVTEEPAVSLAPRLPEDLQPMADVVTRAVHKKVDRRFQTAGEFRDAVRDILVEARKAVGTEAIAAMMQNLFAAECGQGPTVDTYPFGASYHDGVPAMELRPADAQGEAKSEAPDEGWQETLGGDAAMEPETDRPPATARRVENRFPSQPTQPFVQTRAQVKRGLSPWLFGGGLVVLLVLVGIGVVVGGGGDEAAPAVTTTESVTRAEAVDVPPAETEPGWVTIRSARDGVGISVGERELGQTPIDRLELPAGEVSIRWVSLGEERERTISILPNRTSRIFIEASP